jgi:DNA repair protein SbcD/Mre11
MKLLHTSDWHIGRKLETKSLDETLSYFFLWLEKTIIEKKIDVLVVAGDIFNNPFPSNSALSLYYKTLYKLSQTDLKSIIITGGNHDSVSTLNAPNDLLNEMDISVIGGMPENIDDLIIEIKNEDKIEMVVCAVPFLREKDVRLSVSGADYSQRIKLFGEGIERFYAQVGEKVTKYKQKNIPVIVTGHLFVNDIKNMSDDIKELYVGGLQQLSFSQLPDVFDYIALGHIHKPMKVGGREDVRYSGSPITMNFGESNNKNQVVIVDFVDEKPKIEVEYIPVFRNLVSFKGTYKEIDELISNYEDNNELKTWVSIEIIEEKIDPLLEMKIQTLRELSDKIEIVKLKYSYTDAQNEIEKKFENNVSLNDLKPDQIFDHILDNVKEEERKNLRGTFNDLLNNHLYEES